MATIDYSEEEWKQISDGIDKLLDLEARQPRKTIKSVEFGTLEQLLIRIERITGEKPHRRRAATKVITTGDVDWFKPGIHLRNPSTKAIEDAKEDAVNKGFDAVYIHLVEGKPQMTKRR